jgi:Tfp pilus assembly protein PilF
MLDNIERERAGYQMFTFFEETKKHLQAGRYRQALEVVNKAIVIDDTQVSAYFLRAQAFLGLKRYS